MDSKKLLTKVPKEWISVSEKQANDFGCVKSEDFEFLGAFLNDNQIIFFHKYPLIQNFLLEMKQALLNVYSRDKSEKNKNSNVYVFVEMAKFNGLNFLFNISKVAGSLKLSLQIFCEFENENFGVATAIDDEKSLSIEKLVAMPIVKQILNIFVSNKK